MRRRRRPQTGGGSAEIEIRQGEAEPAVAEQPELEHQPAGEERVACLDEPAEAKSKMAGSEAEPEPEPAVDKLVVEFGGARGGRFGLGARRDRTRSAFSAMRLR